jgi:excisionase family DNA binding protein
MKVVCSSYFTKEIDGRMKLQESAAGGGQSGVEGNRVEWLLPQVAAASAEDPGGNGRYSAHGPRRDEISGLRARGFTYSEIGRHYGISRERVRQIMTVRPARPKPDLRSKPTLTPAEVGRLLGVHTGTVRKWANRGLLRSFRVGTRRDRRFLRDDILCFLNGEGGSTDTTASLEGGTGTAMRGGGTDSQS